MTYYEEFGVDPNATPDEIRQAHRRLVKILHPDLQTEEGNRQLADIQTRRVNGISQILLDTSRRREYDRSLEPEILLPVPFKRRTWTAGLLVSAIAILFTGWILNLDRLPPAPQPTVLARETPTSTIEHRAKAAESAPVKTIERPSTSPERPPDRSTVPHDDPTAQADQAPREPNRPAAAPESTRPSSLPFSTPAPSVAAQTSRATESKAEPPETNPLTGTWIYVPQPIAEADKNLYRPEYIEMRIRDIKGILEGQYRARYHVPDRPLSPNVEFHFAGPPRSGTVALHWQGPSGLAGQLELKLLNANAVQADWKVTEMAASADLVSGTAILTRVQ